MDMLKIIRKSIGFGILSMAYLRLIYYYQSKLLVLCKIRPIIKVFQFFLQNSKTKRILDFYLTYNLRKLINVTCKSPIRIQIKNCLLFFKMYYECHSQIQSTLNIYVTFPVP
jgi:hypothetical protein